MMASIAIFQDGKMLIAQRSEHEQFLSGYWTGIGGKVEDSDQDLEAAARREAKEETNLDVEVIMPIVIEEFTREDKPGIKAINVVYLCKDGNSSEIKLSPEHRAYRWIDREELHKIEKMTDFAKKNLDKIFDQYLKIKNNQLVD